MAFDFKVKQSDLDFEKSENSPFMKRLLMLDIFKKSLDKYSEREKFYSAFKANIGKDYPSEILVKIALKKTLGEYMDNKSDSISAEVVEAMGVELFGDESYSKRFIMPQ